MRAIGSQQTEQSQELLLRRELRMFKMASLLIGYFAFAWISFAVLAFCMVTIDEDLDEWER